MTQEEAELLGGEALRLGLKVDARKHGRECQLRFIYNSQEPQLYPSDHWHRNFKSAATALLEAIPTGATMPMFQGWAHRK